MEGLGISLPILLAQIVNFLLLLGLLYLVAYRPIIRMLDVRSKRVRESMEQTELIKQQAEQAEEEVKKQLAEASKQGQEMIAQAVRTGEEVRDKTQQEARQQAEAILNRAHLEIQRERDEAVDQLRQEFAELTIMAAEKVIERSLDKKAHRELIDKVLKESPTLKKG